jgi:hypothetical protein
MTEITLDFLSGQQVRLLEEMRGIREEMGQMRDDIRVMAAIVQGLDGTMQGLVNEVRASHARFDRLYRRLRALETEEKLP